MPNITDQLKGFVCHSDDDITQEALERLQVTKMYFDSMKNDLQRNLNISIDVANEDNDYLVNLGLTPVDEDNKILKNIMKTATHAMKTLFDFFFW